MAFERTLATIFARRRISADVLNDKFVRQRFLLEAIDRLGNPEKGVKFVHVTGTNGKGTTSTKIASMISACSASDVGLFTSPHVLSFRERIRVNNDFISRDEVVKYHHEISKSFPDNSPPLFFEECFLMALMHFRERKVEWAVLEAGMGGLLDSTNVITPEVSVVTSVGWDHMSILGDTLEKIAEEKAGIAKPYVPLVVGPQAAKFSIFAQKAKELNCPLLELSSAWLPHNIPLESLSNNELNTVLAARAVDALMLPPLTEHDIQTSLRVQMPFRFQALPPAALQRAEDIALSDPAVSHHTSSESQNPKHSTTHHAEESEKLWGVVLDAGHNLSAIERLADDAESSKHVTGIKKIIVVSTLSAERHINVLKPLTTKIGEESLLQLNVVVGAHPRLKSETAIRSELERDQEFAKQLTLRKESVGAVVREAVRRARSEGALVVITGSFFIMPEALEGMGLLPGWTEKADGTAWFPSQYGVSDWLSEDVERARMPHELDEDCDVMGFRKGWWLGTCGDCERSAALVSGVMESMKRNADCGSIVKVGRHL